MNTLAILTAAQPLGPLLISFLFAVLILAFIGGLLWCIERYVSPIPAPIKVVLAIVLLIMVVIWGLREFGIA